MEDQPEVLTVREVAQWLRVSEQTIHRELVQGRLHGFKVRDAWRIERSAVRAYIERQPAPIADGELTSFDVATRIGRSRETAWRLMASGKIASIRRGRVWYTTDAAVQQWVEDQRHEQ